MKKMIKLSVILMLALSVQALVAQTATVGDYRSAGTGNWSTLSTWEIRTGANTWATPGSVPAAANNVYIQSGHTVTVDIATANCNDLHLQSTGVLSIGTNTVQVSGKTRSYNSNPITNVQVASGIATLTTATNPGFSVNQTVIVTGFPTAISSVSTTALNATVTITAVTTSSPFTFSYTTTVGNIANTTSGTTTASVTVGNNAVNGSTDGSFYTVQFSSTSVNSTMCTTSAGTGFLKFIGTKRNVTNANEWTGNSVNFASDVIFAMNSNTDTAFINTVFGGRSITFASGVVNAGSNRLTASNGSTGTGTATIKTGASLISNANASQVLCRTSTAACASLTIESGGNLILTGAAPQIDALAYTNNGNVIYNRSGAQTLLAKSGLDATAIDFTAYNNLTIQTSNAKTIPSGVTINVSGTFTLGGSTSTCILASTGGSSLTYSPGATLALNGSQSIVLTTSSLEWPATNGPTNITCSANILSFSAGAGISRTITGTLTFNGGSFTINSGNTLVMGNNSTIMRSSASGSLSFGTGATFNIGTSSTDVLNLTMNSGTALIAGNEFQSSPTPGSYGTLTIASGTGYSIASSRALTNINNSGIFTLNPTTSLTLTVAGTLSGSGTFTGHDSASISFTGAVSGSAGTLNFTNGTAYVNNLTVNRTGTSASVTLGQGIRINRTLALTAGTLDGGSFIDTLRGSISGSGTFTTTTGKIVLVGTGTTTPYTISSAKVSYIEMGSSGYSMTGSTTINGTLDLKSFVLSAATSTLVMATGSTLSRTTGWINGALRKNIAVGTNITRTYEIGDATNYAPVSLFFTAITTQGDITVKSAAPATTEANYASLPISKADYVNKYWTITNVNTFAATGGYAATLNYVSGDLVGTATANNVIAAQFAAAAWSSFSTTAGTNANTVNLTLFGDIILAKTCVGISPSVSISANPGINICAGTSVAFTATPVSGGSAPQYQWKLNGGNVGTASSSYSSSTLANNDLVSVELTPNNGCTTGFVNDSKTMTVSNPTITPSVSISSNLNNVCAYIDVAFTAVPVNGGTNPNYNFKVNGISKQNGPGDTYNSTTLANNDVVTCVITRSDACANSNTSNSVIMTIKPTPIAPLITSGVVLNCTLGSATALHANAWGGRWNSSNQSVATLSTGPSGSSSINVTGIGNGTTTISYTLTNSTTGCTSSVSTPYLVAAVPVNPISSVSSACLGGATFTATNNTVIAAPLSAVWGSDNNRVSIDNTGLATTGTNPGTGYISYTVTNATTGCATKVVKTITVNPLPAIPVVNVTPRIASLNAVCAGQDFQFSGSPAGGVWSTTAGAGIATLSAGGLLHTVGAGSASLSYTVTNVNGCSNTRTFAGTIVSCFARNASNLITQSTNQQINLYPNPAKGVVSLKVDKMIGEGTFVITDIYGKVVYSSIVNSPSTLVDISHLGKGLYLVSIITSEGKVTKKLIVE